MEEEICNAVSATWEEQGAKETYPGAEPWFLQCCSESQHYHAHPVPHEHPSAPHEAARSLTGKTAEAARKPIQHSLAAFSALQTIAT